MARRSALYEVTDARSDEVLSRHRTRQAAVDSWRSREGVPIKIFRLEVPNGRKLIAEGIWHESARL